MVLPSSFNVGFANRWVIEYNFQRSAVGTDCSSASVPSFTQSTSLASRTGCAKRASTSSKLMPSPNAGHRIATCRFFIVAPWHSRTRVPLRCWPRRHQRRPRKYRYRRGAIERMVPEISAQQSLCNRTSRSAWTPWSPCVARGQPVPHHRLAVPAATAMRWDF